MNDPRLHDATCIGCGCTDSHACEGSCYWIEVDRILGVGVCSNCLPHLRMYHARRRDPWAIAKRLKKLKERVTPALSTN